MADIYVEEPGQAGGLHAVQRAQVADRLIFPHVDTCMAVIFFLTDGTAIGGHVPMQWHGDDPLIPAQNFRRVVRMMIDRIPHGRRVTRAVSVGDENSAIANGIPYEVNSLRRLLAGRLTPQARVDHQNENEEHGFDLYVRVRDQHIDPRARVA